MICGLTLSTYSQNVFNKKNNKEGCISGDCENGYGTYKIEDGSEYVGYFKNGIYHNHGAMTLNDGTIKEGLWLNGILIIKLEDIYNKTKSKKESEMMTLDNYEEGIFRVVEQMPVFPGGDLELLKYIQRNVRYPQIAKEYGIEGRVFVTFTVDKDGSVTGVKIVSGVDKHLDMEAFRVVRSIPKFKPGFQRGQPVRVQFTVPISFKLQ